MNTSIATLIFHYLFGKNRRGVPRALAPIIAIALGIATVVLVLNVSNGMIQGIASRFIETGTYHIKGYARQPISDASLETFRQEVLDIDSVLHVFPERTGIGLLGTGGEQRQGVRIRALASDIWESDPGFRENIEILTGEFRLGSTSGRPDILIGANIADELNVAVGDTVELITLHRVGSGRNALSIPRVRSYTVQGIFTAGYRDLDREWIFIPFSDSHRILDAATSQTLLGIKVTDPFGLSNPVLQNRRRPEVTRAYQNILHVLGDTFFVSTWYRQEAGRFLNFRATKNILLFITALIICVALTQIVSALFILTVEKLQEIAILKAMGMFPHAIRTLFIGCGFCIGFLGAVIGIAVGMLFTINVNTLLRGIEFLLSAGQRLLENQNSISLTELREEFYLQTIPVVLSPVDLYVLVLITVLLAMVASYIPARRAAAIAPLAVLQNR